MRDGKRKADRYLGVTHYESGGFADAEKILAGEKLDLSDERFHMEREAEEQILPLAQDRSVAVIVNRPFSGGDLFQCVRSKPLPVAAEFDCFPGPNSF